MEKKANSTLKELTSIKQALDVAAIVAITDRRGIITHVNEKFCQISKYSRDELLGQNHRILKSGHHPDEFYVDLWKTISHGHVWEGEICNRARDGSFYWVNTCIIPFLDEHNKPYQYVSIRYEITQRKEAETQLISYSRQLEQVNDDLARRTKELSQSNAELEQFAYVASHDLQEPLRMIGSFTELLARRYKQKLDKDADQFIHYIVDGTKRMRALVGDLLLLSRVGTQGKEGEQTDVNEVIGRVLSDLTVSMSETGAVVTKDQLPTIMADRLQIAQLFQNLIGNSIKFKSNSAPKIHISAKMGDGEWIFSVSDNGIGIDPEYFGRVFMIFQRLQDREAYPGTGIGLAICKKIVERHRGRIWIESQPGKGSTFFFSIPIRLNEGGGDA